MVTPECCYLVGSYEISVDGIISISTRSSTDTTLTGDNVIVGPTIGNVSVVAYAGNVIHDGCPAKANVNIPWLRKYDCDTDTIHFIFNGQGNSSISGPITTEATLNQAANDYMILNASASSGPSTIYEEVRQYDGYGLTYNLGPWDFDTTNEDDLLIDTTISTFGDMYLTSFTYQANSGQFPTASYEFLRVLNNGAGAIQIGS